MHTTEISSDSLEFKSGKYVFFFGGNDAEMQTIRDRLNGTEYTMFDKNLGWGARASEYEAEIAMAISRGRMPILIELSLDGISPELSGMISAGLVRIIDHHGERTHEEASILQVIRLLGVAPTRMEIIVAANDSAYISGMQKIGATPEEIARVRALERRAQGITEDMEQEAERAIAQKERFPEFNDLIVVRMKHSKTSTVTDRLYGTQEKEHILILSEDGEVNYYGDGELCQNLKEKFGGWSGGSGFGKAGENAFWGGNTAQMFHLFQEIQRFHQVVNNSTLIQLFNKSGIVVVDSLGFRSSGRKYGECFHTKMIDEVDFHEGEHNNRPKNISKIGTCIVSLGTVTYQIQYLVELVPSVGYTGHDGRRKLSCYQKTNRDEEILSIKKL